MNEKTCKICGRVNPLWSDDYCHIGCAYRGLELENLKLKQTRGGKREGAGRPLGTARPSNLKMRSIRMTDEEYKLTKEYIKQLRATTR